jgi:pimeloyl-ACP methyl ester carboxylesterase
MADNAVMLPRLLLGILFALLLAATLLPLAHYFYVHWVRRRFPLVGDVLVHDGVRLHYMHCGRGPTVVLVHGANGTWNDFPPELITDLARDHVVIALDRPGHGWSDAHEGALGLRENAAALVAVLRTHRLTGATLVGHSYGAAVALRAALDAPELVAHVVAVAPCTVIDKRNARYSAPAWVVGPAGRTLLHFIALLMIPFGLPLRRQAYHPERAPRNWGASRAFMFLPTQMHATVRNFHTLHADLAWLEDHLPRLAARLTVLVGAADQVTPPARHVEWLRRKMPAARIEVLPRVGHWLPRLQPGLVAAAVRTGTLARSPVPLGG